MIPNNIDRQAVLEAIKYIDKHGIPKNRVSRNYNVKCNGRLYPPKYLISIANKLVNSKELEPFSFGGGAETNNFLRKLGFEVVPYEIFDNETTEKICNKVSIVTVVVGNEDGVCPKNTDRFIFMEDILRENRTSDIVLFPAGYFCFDEQRKEELDALCKKISMFLNSIDSNSVICVGIDCDEGVDQLAFAVSRDGVQAMGRKFYPTGYEDGCIRQASSYNSIEMGFSRIFKVKDYKVYLAVCYDGFGIRQCDLDNPGVDMVMVLAHRFCKRGEGPSGDVDFARKGFAGASQHWKCPVFGTAVFFCRDIPKNWPTGVLWIDQSKSVRHFKYTENALAWEESRTYLGRYEYAVSYRYTLPEKS